MGGTGFVKEGLNKTIELDGIRVKKRRGGEEEKRKKQFNRALLLQ